MTILCTILLALVVAPVTAAPAVDAYVVQAGDRVALTIATTGTTKNPVAPTLAPPTSTLVDCPPTTGNWTTLSRSTTSTGWTIRGSGMNRTYTYGLDTSYAQAGQCWAVAFALSDGTTKTFTLAMFRGPFQRD